MREFCFIFICMLLLCNVSCNHRDLSMSDYSRLKHSKITFPKNLKSFNTSTEFKTKKPYKLLVLKDSLSCTPCYVKGLNEWNMFVSALKPNMADICFVLIPKKSEYVSVTSVLRQKGYNWNIFVDTDGKFLQSNKQIPTDNIYHCMLLDSRNRVVIIGNPLKNKSVAKLMIKEINSHQNI